MSTHSPKDMVDFVVVGSGGGGGTISWLLAKAGFSVVVIEQGPDFARPVQDSPQEFTPAPHDEYRFRLEHPDPKRRPRGSYNTFRQKEDEEAKPFDGAWTGSVVGGGSVLWGTWSFRALPIDFRLKTFFDSTGQAKTLEDWGYSVPDWPVSYKEMESFYNVAETLLAVSGSREAVNTGVRKSQWFQQLRGEPAFRDGENWFPDFPFPCPEYPRTPVGQLFFRGAEAAGFHPLPIPTGIVSPNQRGGYQTRKAIGAALKEWGRHRPDFWKQDLDALWSDRVRSACNMCGFCGEFLCWGKEPPKSGGIASTLKELRDRPNARIVPDGFVFEVLYDSRVRRAAGVRYLDVSDPDHPRECVQKARYVILACGAVQSPRLLMMSGGPGGLGNRYGQLGRYASFHLFGLGISATLPPAFQGMLHGEYGHTGNTTSFEHYFVQDEAGDGLWWKAGILASAAKKNPLENAAGELGRGRVGLPLLEAMEAYARRMEVRLMGDDLPMARNRVDLDPQYVDEYGFPVARVTRSFGPAEQKMFKLMEPLLGEVMQHYVDNGILKKGDIKFSKGIPDLIGDHQMGTCRMGDDPTQSVLDRHCRLHDVPNLFVVDSSFMPTGLGLNPMVTVVANALRVGTWIVEQSKHGQEL